MTFWVLKFIQKCVSNYLTMCPRINLNSALERAQKCSQDQLLTFTCISLYTNYIKVIIKIKFKDMVKGKLIKLIL